MNKPLMKTLLGIFVLLAGIHGAIWYKTAADIKASAMRDIGLATERYATVGGELEVGQLSVSGYPLSFHLNIAGARLAVMPPQAGEAGIIIEDDFGISANLFSDHIRFHFPKSILMTQSVGTEQLRFLTDFDTAGHADFYIGQKNYKTVIDAVFNDTQSPIAIKPIGKPQGFKMHVPAGTYAIVGQDKPLTLMHWRAQQFDTQITTHADGKMVMDYDVNLGGIIFEEKAYLAWLENSPVLHEIRMQNPAMIDIPRSWMAYIDSLDISFDNMRFEGAGQISQHQQTGQVTIKGSNAIKAPDWTLALDGEIKVNPQRDPAPYGQGQLAVTNFDKLHHFAYNMTSVFQQLVLIGMQVSPQAQHPAAMQFVQSLDPEYVSLVLSILQHIGQSDNAGQDFVVNINRPVGQSMKVNDLTTEQVMQLFMQGVQQIEARRQAEQQRLYEQQNPPAPEAPEAKPEPRPTPEEAMQQRQQRVKEWADNYEKNIDTIIQKTEDEDKARLEQLEQRERMQATKEAAQKTIEQSQQRQKATEQYQQFQQQKKFATPDSEK